MSSAHSPTFPLLHLCHSSFSNPSFSSPTSQALHLIQLASRPWPELILQPFRHFTYVTTHSPTPPLLYLRHSSFSNPYVASPTSQFILQVFFRFSYVTNSSLNSTGEPLMSRAHSPTFPSFHLRHNSFFNPSVALPTSQLILQTVHCFTYVTVHSQTVLSLLLRHKLVT